MRVVKLTWNERISADANYALQTEVLVDEDEDAEQAGRDALSFLNSFQAGMRKQSAEMADDG